MSYILMFCTGGFLGVLTTAIIASGSYAEKLQDAYNKGYNAGLKKSEQSV